MIEYATFSLNDKVCLLLLALGDVLPESTLYTTAGVRVVDLADVHLAPRASWVLVGPVVAMIDKGLEMNGYG